MRGLTVQGYNLTLWHTCRVGERRGGARGLDVRVLYGVTNWQALQNHEFPTACRGCWGVFTTYTKYKKFCKKENIKFICQKVRNISIFTNNMMTESIYPLAILISFTILACIVRYLTKKNII